MVEIEQIMTAWEGFKEEFKDELDDFNHQRGNYDRGALVSRAEQTKMFPKLMKDMPEYLAIGDLIESIQSASINDLIDKHASERGWGKNVQEMDWKDDDEKGDTIELYLTQPHFNLENMIPFDFIYDSRPQGFNWVSISSYPLVILQEEAGIFKACFGEDYLFRNQVNNLTSIPNHYNR